MERGFYDGLPPVILASKSPRRAELLRGMGIRFEVVGSDVDEGEAGRGVPLERLPERLAKCKAEAVAAQCVGKMVIGADTLVLMDGEPLHKPRGSTEACEVLRKLSGRVHRVLTGVCISYDGECESFTACTEVCFRTLLPVEIDYYVHTFSPYDKAGGYGIQEWIGMVGVSWIRGSYTNVVGLPTEALSERLSHHIVQDR